MFTIIGSLFWLAIIIVFGLFLLLFRIIAGLLRPFGKGAVQQRGPAGFWQGEMLTRAGRFSVNGQAGVPIYEDNSGSKYIKASDYDSSIREIARRASTDISYNFMVDENGTLRQYRFYPFKA